MKILIVCVNFNVGGVRSSLTNFVKGALKENDICHIQALKSNDDEFVKKLSSISANISVCHRMLFYDSYYEPVSFFIKKRKYGSILLKILLMFVRNIIGAEKTLSFLSRITSQKKDYDIAISFENDIWSGKIFSGGANQYVLKNVEAKKKIAWIHSEPSYYGLTHTRGLNCYKDFDAIVNVSYACKAMFDAIVPEYSTKSFVVYNFFDKDYIARTANLYCPIKLNEFFNIITVSRIVDKAKKIERIIEISRILKQSDIAFNWYVIGDGPLLKKMKLYVDQFDLKDNVFFLGQIKEPYNYISKCDLFVLPSEQESFGMVLVESLLCGVPVVCSKYAASKEIVDDKVNGVIVNNDVEEFAETIKKIIQGEIIFDRSKLIFTNKAEQQYADLLSALGA